MAADLCPWGQSSVVDERGAPTLVFQGHERAHQPPRRWVPTGSAQALAVTFSNQKHAIELHLDQLSKLQMQVQRLRSEAEYAVRDS